MMFSGSSLTGETTHFFMIFDQHVYYKIQNIENVMQWSRNVLWVGGAKVFSEGNLLAILQCLMFCVSIGK